MGSLSADVTGIAELARKHWPKYYALLLAEILSSVLATGILVVVNPEITAKLITYFIVWGITYIIWWYTNRLPKTKKGKVGFLISITTGEESERKKIMEDFVTTLHELLKGGTSGQPFQLIKAPEHVAERIVDIDDAERLRHKC